MCSQNSARKQKPKNRVRSVWTKTQNTAQKNIVNSPTKHGYAVLKNNPKKYLCNSSLNEIVFKKKVTQNKQVGTVVTNNPNKQWCSPENIQKLQNASEQKHTRIHLNMDRQKNAGKEEQHHTHRETGQKKGGQTDTVHGNMEYNRKKIKHNKR